MSSEERGGIVLFLDRGKLSVYDGRRIVHMEISPSMVKDMEVVNGEALKSQVLTFFNTERIKPAYMVLVLAESVCFLSDIQGASEAEVAFQFGQFSASIPFDSVISKRYPAAKGAVGVASNMEIINIITDCLEQRGYKLLAIIPSIILDQQKFKGGLSMEMGKYLLYNSLYFAAQSMLEKEEYAKEKVTSSLIKKNKYKVPILLSIFFVFLIILVVLIISG